MKYVLISYDENKTSYFYNLEDGYLYSDHEKIQSETINRYSYLGGILGIILYIALANISANYFNGITTTFIAIILGLVLALIITHILIKNTSKFFIKKNRLETTYEIVSDLAKHGELYYKKYNRLMIGLFVFTLVSTFVLLSNQSVLIFTSKLLLWVLCFLMYLKKRPICFKKFKELLKAKKLISLKR